MSNIGNDNENEFNYLITIKEDMDTSKELFVLSAGNLGPKYSHFRQRAGQAWSISCVHLKIKDMEGNILRESHHAKDFSGTAFWKSMFLNKIQLPAGDYEIQVNMWSHSEMI